MNNASRRAERFWPDDRRHKQLLGAVYTVSAVYMLGYQQIHQLVSVEFVFFKKRSSLGFPETLCLFALLRCAGGRGFPAGVARRSIFLLFLPPKTSQDVVTSRFCPTFPSQSHAVPPNRFLPVHIGTFLAAVPAGAPGKRPRPRPVSACGNSSWRCSRQ